MLLSPLIGFSTDENGPTKSFKRDFHILSMMIAVGLSFAV